MTQASYIQVALNVPLRRIFDYRVDPPLATPAIGARVRVPFGRQQKIGIVINTKVNSSIDPKKIKSIIAVLDEQPIVSQAMMELAKWCSDYYQHPIGEVLVGTLPTALRQGKGKENIKVTHYVLSSAGHQALADQPLTRAPKQRALLQWCAEHHGIDRSTLKETPFNSPQLRTVIDKGYLESKKTINTASIEDQHFLTLNPEQQQAYDTIQADNDFKVFLLYGVTGSGKTEVYLHWIRDLINQQKQVLVLVPEIALTPQTQARFAERFKMPIVMLHSKRNPSQQLEGWYQSHLGEASIVIGTRSALFCSIPRLGGIVIDEEHDSSFKQQEGFRYHARDVAIMRAKMENIPIVLGSATPSLESFHNAKRGRYHWLALQHRAGGATPPSMEVIDVRKHRPQQGLSSPLIQAIKQHLEQRQQVLLFINRRGFAPLLFCEQCGWSAMCPNCDVKMVLHKKRQRLECHHCGAKRKIPSQCESCQFPDIVHLGIGTEQVEQACQQHFPDHNILRMDRDSMRHKHSFDTALQQIKNHAVDIIIGTQMMAKGHHFDRLSLVAILDVDQGLFSTDFRGLERLGQLITQVAGRSGRGQRQGAVILQSNFPEHPMLSDMLHKTYTEWMPQLLEERQRLHLPPTSHWVLLQARSQDKQKAQEFLLKAKQWLQSRPKLQCELFGPSDCAVSRKMNQHQLQLCIASHHRAPLKRFIFDLVQQKILPPSSPQLRWFIDVDPL